jgi:hypothetical protein
LLQYGGIALEVENQRWIEVATSRNGIYPYDNSRSSNSKLAVEIMVYNFFLAAMA